MPSSSHQWLLLWIGRKMAADGFVVAGCDGSMPQGGLWNFLPRPPEFAGVRPDACGLSLGTGEYAFGEAKTSQDINSVHTRMQLRVFGHLTNRNDRMPCRLYVAVPRSAARDLDCVLRQVGLLGARHVVRLHVPDCLLEETANEHT